MLRHAISHARLMRESTDRVERALESTDHNERLVARRILENPIAWSNWESEHSVLMRQVANCGVQRAQVAALKHATFRLVHGKALFQYLQRGAVRGRERYQVMAHFRPGRNYENAVVAEHSVFLRKACSYLCASHVGSDVVQDPAFLDPMQSYERLYAEYFSVYCSSLVDSPDSDALSQVALLPLLKKQLNEYRWAILDPRRAQPFLRREAELRTPTGDTQRLPALASRPRGRS
ncbi:MAG: hypothetical protein QOD56_1636 [Gammaproteobacteria bacterium]|jgi:hypothetical protein|nr:hypothetical protein [Gammaproteobacteria bacterium]